MAHGSITIPEAIDRLSYSSPEKILIRFAASSEAFQNKNLTPITSKTLANAINRLAWHFSKTLPRLGNLETTICYLGPSDIRYFIVACAATKCRVNVLLSSPRNNQEAHEALFQQTQCRILVGPLSFCKSLRDACSMEHVEVPELEDLLNEDAVEKYPWNRSLAEVAHEPFVVLHTSGSTGQPKRVDVTHGLVATIDSQQDLPDVSGRCITSRMWKDVSLYGAMPLFHSAGFNVLAFSIYQGTELILGPSDQPPSVSTVEHVLESNFATNGLIPPSLLAEIANEETVLPKLSCWRSVAFGGGPLDEQAAKLIWKYTQILPLLGSTETFNIPELAPQSEDELAYHYFHPSLGIDFQPVSDNLHELVFVRDQKVAKHQGAFHTFRNLKEYRMKDLYESHPTKPGLWKYRGRLDDVIVLSNGEKLNPCEAEKVISAHGEIQSALIVGTGREQPLLLVEPKRRGSVDDLEELAEELRIANSKLPAHGQIHSSHVCIVEPESFLRSSKGEVRRGPTVDTLQGYIEQKYEVAETSTTPHSNLDFSTTQGLASSLTHAISSQILSGEPLEPTDNIFQYGVDSLHVLRLTRMIKADMQAQQVEGLSKVTPKTIYNQRTPAKIAQYLKGGAGQDDLANTQHEMQQMLESHLKNLPKERASSASQTYLITGSTGSLGSYLLDALLQRRPTANIICLNRPGGNSSKQEKMQRSRGLGTDFPRVQFLEGNISEERFGLDEDSYRELEQTTHIIHNAWPVNWNLPLAAFEDQLKACRLLIALAHSANHDMSIIFLSSIGAANRWTDAGFNGPVPEAKLDQFVVAEPTGYAQSKLLAEHIFCAANERLKVPVTICRLGQIAGPVTSFSGMWSPQEWFPSIILTSKKMRKLPKSLASMDRVDWIPVDILADILVDVIDSPAEHEQLSSDKSLPDGVQLAQQIDSLSFPGSFPDDVNGDSHPISEGSSESNDSDMYSPSDTPISSYTPLSSTRRSLEISPKQQSPAAFVHLVNPHSLNWQDLAPSVAKLLGDEVQLVSFQQWMSELSARTESSEDGGDEDLPAAKLLDFLNEMSEGGDMRPMFSVEKSWDMSRGLRSLPPVSGEWMERWCYQWAAAGLLG